MIKIGATYVFQKSGNRVRAVQPTNYGGVGSWVVERVDGRSAGKKMVVHGRALVENVN